MTPCSLCPRNCGVDRSIAVGYCGAGEEAHIACAGLHLWEEPCISGERGSGAVFFSGCNLDCLFCQNYRINHTMRGRKADAAALAEIMTELEAAGAHNINLVTPTPHTALIIDAIALARKHKMSLPIVWNTNAYENVTTLQRLEGLVDVYLPDLKYVGSTVSARYSDAADYFSIASKAILEMHRQVGDLRLDENGMAVRGLIIRHLVLPGSVDETRKALDFIAANLPLTTQLSLMCQYVPCHRATMPPINRTLTKGEYERALRHCMDLGFENVFIQEFASADGDYTPPFDD